MISIPHSSSYRVHKPAAVYVSKCFLWISGWIYYTHTLTNTNCDNARDRVLAINMNSRCTVERPYNFVSVTVEFQVSALVLFEYLRAMDRWNHSTPRTRQVFLTRTRWRAVKDESIVYFVSSHLWHLVRMGKMLQNCCGCCWQHLYYMQMKRIYVGNVQSRT